VFVRDLEPEQTHDIDLTEQRHALTTTGCCEGRLNGYTVCRP
jgi:hypothetical protein